MSNGEIILAREKPWRLYRPLHCFCCTDGTQPAVQRRCKHFAFEQGSCTNRNASETDDVAGDRNPLLEPNCR